jgi:hypothetical protein
MKQHDGINAKEASVLVLGALLIVFGVVIIAGALMEWFDHTSKNSLGTDITALVLFGIAPAAIGFVLCLHMILSTRRRRFVAYENVILAMAAQRNQRVTAAEVAVETQLLLAEAQRVLDHYCEKGTAQIEISKTGVKVYWFWELISDEEKKAELI